MLATMSSIDGSERDIGSRGCHHGRWADGVGMAVMMLIVVSGHDRPASRWRGYRGGNRGGLAPGMVGGQVSRLEIESGR
jgi:hypothetical protein